MLTLRRNGFNLFISIPSALPITVYALITRKGNRVNQHKVTRLSISGLNISISSSKSCLASLALSEHLRRCKQMSKSKDHGTFFEMIFHAILTMLGYEYVPDGAW